MKFRRKKWTREETSYLRYLTELGVSASDACYIFGLNSNVLLYKRTQIGLGGPRKKQRMLRVGIPPPAADKLSEQAKALGLPIHSYISLLLTMIADGGTPIDIPREYSEWKQTGSSLVSEALTRIDKITKVFAADTPATGVGGSEKEPRHGTDILGERNSRGTAVRSHQANPARSETRVLTDQIAGGPARARG